MKGQDLFEKVSKIHDFPKPGVMFYDLWPIMSDPTYFISLIRHLTKITTPKMSLLPNKIIGIEARGFPIAAAIAMRLGAGFVPARKVGKLPPPTIQEKLKLEYGEAILEMQEGAIKPGEGVLIVDDVLATGGTAKAVGELVRRMGGTVYGYVFALEIPHFGGRAFLGHKTIIAYMRSDR